MLGAARQAEAARVRPQGGGSWANQASPRLLAGALGLDRVDRGAELVALRRTDLLRHERRDLRLRGVEARAWTVPLADFTTLVIEFLSWLVTPAGGKSSVVY